VGIVSVVVVEGEQIVFQVKGHGVRLPHFLVPGKGWPRQEKKDKD